MIIEFLKKYQIVIFILLLLMTAAIMIFVNKANKPKAVENEVKKEKKVADTKPIKPTVTAKTTKEIKPKVVLKKPITSPIFDTKIDYVGKNDPLTYSKPSSDIDQIMQEHKKIHTLAEEKNPLANKEDWKVDYGVGLEDGAIDYLKSDPSLKSDMVNVKVGFSKSF